VVELSCFTVIHRSATVGNMDPTPSEIVHAALDGLLTVVGKAADDLRSFHDAVAKARVAPLPPFPRSTVLVTERIVEHLTKVDRDLREVLVALGLQDLMSRTAPPQ